MASPDTTRADRVRDRRQHTVMAVLTAREYQRFLELQSSRGGSKADLVRAAIGKLLAEQQETSR